MAPAVATDRADSLLIVVPSPVVDASGTSGAGDLAAALRVVRGGRRR